MKTTPEIIETKVNEIFRIELPSNVAEGKRWIFKTPIDTTFLELKSKKYISKESDIDGSPGKELLVFRALKKGKTEIELAYAYHFEPEIPKNAKVVSFQIEIRD